jgi:hypothetical protein
MWVRRSTWAGNAKMIGDKFVEITIRNVTKSIVASNVVVPKIFHPGLTVDTLVLKYVLTWIAGTCVFGT